MHSIQKVMVLLFFKMFFLLNMIQEIEVEKGLSLENTLGFHHFYWLHYNGHDSIKNSNIKL